MWYNYLHPLQTDKLWETVLSCSYSHLQDHGFCRKQEKRADGALGILVFALVLVGIGATESTEPAATEAEAHTGKQEGQEQTKGHCCQDGNQPVWEFTYQLWGEFTKMLFAINCNYKSTNHFDLPMT